MDEPTLDLLQIKIEKAKAQLTDETLSAINAVDWKDAILKTRVSKGYSFEQLGALETETELVLCGLLNPRDYSKEIQQRMGISKTQTNELVNEMNKQVFSKIKEELIKNSERKNTLASKQAQAEPTPIPDKQQHEDAQTLRTAGIEILPEKLEIISPSPSQGEGSGMRSILEQKMSAPVQTPTVKTDHSLPNITPPYLPGKPAVDPYREIPE